MTHRDGWVGQMATDNSNARRHLAPRSALMVHTEYKEW